MANNTNTILNTFTNWIESAAPTIAGHDSITARQGAVLYAAVLIAREGGCPTVTAVRDRGAEFFGEDWMPGKDAKAQANKVRKALTSLAAKDLVTELTSGPGAAVYRADSDSPVFHLFADVLWEKQQGGKSGGPRSSTKASPVADDGEPAYGHSEKDDGFEDRKARVEKRWGDFIRRFLKDRRDELPVGFRDLSNTEQFAECVRMWAKGRKGFNPNCLVRAIAIEYGDKAAA